MSEFSKEAFTLLGVGLCVIGLRTASRLSQVGIRGLKADDYVMLVAAVIYSLETATAYIVGAWWFGLANNGMTDAERQALDPASHEAQLRIGGSKTQLVGWSLYTLLLWTLKICLTIFYSRLVAGIDYLEKRVKIAYFLLAITYAATELSVLLGCRPFKKNWQIYPDPGNHCQPSISKIDLYVTVILNVTTDMYLMSIPIPMLWRATLSLRRRMSLLVVFCGGVFVMVCGILRCAIIINSPVTGAQAAGSWACRETFIAVVVGNLPLIYPVASRQVDRLVKSSLLSRYNKNSSSDKTPPEYPLHATIGSERARVRGGRKGVRSKHALPTTLNNYSEVGSEEKIIGLKSDYLAQTIVEEDRRESREAAMGEGITVTTEAEISSQYGKDGKANRGTCLTV